MNERKKQIEEAADNHCFLIGEDKCGVVHKTFEAAAQWADANPPTTGDDERDAKAYAFAEAESVIARSGGKLDLVVASNASINAFLAGRRGMVPASTVNQTVRQIEETARKEERERCAKIVHDRHGNFGVKTANLILKPDAE